MSLQACQLSYDIPSALDFPNPSGRLRRRGFRINLSCWIIPKDAVPHHLINEMLAAGVNAVLIDFAAGQDEKILALAKQAMQQEIADATRRLQESTSRADIQYDADLGQAEDGRATEKAEKQYRTRTKGALQRAEKLLKDIEAAAARFGLEARRDLPLTTALDQVRGLQATVAARASAYTRLAEQTQGTTMETAAKNDEVPAGVLADYVEERGGDAGNVRELFTDPEPTPAPVPVTVVTEPKAEQTYRLVDRSATVEFTPQADGMIRVVRLWRGVEQSRKLISKDAARLQYNRLMDQGYTKF